MNTRPQRLSALFLEFLNSERSSGVLLLGAMGLSILAANSPANSAVSAVLHQELGPAGLPGLRHSLLEWINEGLMTLFFVLIGLEIEREVYSGELSNPRNALLPFFAALGGMAIPALIHFSLNRGLPTQVGFGIPMATDIAFALGVLSLLGRRVPAAVKVFLAAIAIIDDIGAMIVIALAYSHGLQWLFLALAGAMFALMGLLNFSGIHKMRYYIVPGLLLWYFTLLSGVHTSIAGVVFAFALPYAGGGSASPSDRLEHLLNKPVAWAIMPLFAFANSGVVFGAELVPLLAAPNALGVFLGLLVGKPLGIVGFSWGAVKLGLASLPGEMRRRHLPGLGFLGGIGFTMSIFITVLAFGDTPQAGASKLAILAGSLLAGGLGYALLRFSANPKKRWRLRQRPQTS